MARGSSMLSKRTQEIIQHPSRHAELRRLVAGALFASGLRMAFVDLVNRPELRISRSGSLIVLVFGPGPTKLSDLELILEHEHTVASERGRISIISIGPSASSERLPEEVLRKSAELERWLAEVAIGAATIVPGKGLGATFLRLLRTALSLMRRNAARKKLFGDLGEALTWLKSRPEQVPDVRRITLDQLRQHLKLDRARAA